MKTSHFIKADIETMMRVCSSVAELGSAIEDLNRARMEPASSGFTVEDR